MNTLKDDVLVLNQIAERLSRVRDDATNTWRDVIRKFSPDNSVLNVENTVHLFALGRKDYDVRRLMCIEAGAQLGHHIADKLEYSFDDAMQPCRDQFFGRDHATYRATVHVFTPSELEDLIKSAMAVGQARALV